jgi:hypothetical protein
LLRFYPSLLIHNPTHTTALNYSLLSWSILPRIFGTTAWGISLVVLFDCHFLFLDFYTQGTAAVERLYFGLFYHERYVLLNHTNLGANGNESYVTLQPFHTCGGYNTSEGYTLSSAFVLARTCAILAVVLGGLMSWALWLMYCCRFICMCVPDVAIAFGFIVLLPLFQGLTYLFVNDICNKYLHESDLASLQFAISVNSSDAHGGQMRSKSCGLSSYGVYYPISVVLWMTTGILFLYLRPKKKSDLDAVIMRT